MAGFTKMNFNPETGFNDREVYPTTPVSELKARNSIQGLLEQIKDYINETLISELKNAEDGKSGADIIGSGEISGVTGYTVRSQIDSLAQTVFEATNGLAVPGNDTVSTEKIQNYAVTGIKIADNTISGEKLMSNSVGTFQIADGAITAEKIEGGTFSGSVITDGTISEGKLSNDAVSQLNIKAGAVSNSKLANDAVNTINMINGSVTTDKLANSAVSSAKLGTITSIRLSATGDTVNYNDVSDTWTLNAIGCTPVQLCPVVFGTGATPPSGLFPMGTLYIQHQA